MGCLSGKGSCRINVELSGNGKEIRDPQKINSMERQLLILGASNHQAGGGHERAPLCKISFMHTLLH